MCATGKDGTRSRTGATELAQLVQELWVCIVSISKGPQRGLQLSSGEQLQCQHSGSIVSCILDCNLLLVISSKLMLLSPPIHHHHHHHHQ